MSVGGGGQVEEEGIPNFSFSLGPSGILGKVSGVQYWEKSDCMFLEEGFAGSVLNCSSSVRHIVGA